MYICVCVCLCVNGCVCVCQGRGGYSALFLYKCPQALGIVCTSSKYMREENALGACRGPQRELEVQSLCKQAEGRVRAACARSTV